MGNCELCESSTFTLFITHMAPDRLSPLSESAPLNELYEQYWSVPEGGGGAMGESPWHA